MTIATIVVAIVAFLACATVGGGLYEALVLDPVWPNRPAIIQPRNGGVSRRRFWIPVHAAFEAAVVIAIIACWGDHGVKTTLLIALASHLLLRVWLLVDFGPRTAAFEKGDPATIERAAAQRWTRRSLVRLPLDAVTCVAALGALALM